MTVFDNTDLNGPFGINLNNGRITVNSYSLKAYDMWYVIFSQDVENSLSLRMDARPAHIARLKELQTQGRLLIAGPCPAIDSEDPGEAGFTGSVVVAEFDSLEDAQQWADADPYKAAGVYQSSIVKPYKKVLPA